MNEKLINENAFQYFVCEQLLLITNKFGHTSRFELP